jgi:DHA2 family multidrug resistance protein
MDAKHANPLFISTAVSLAAFMEILDTTIANVALTHIAGSLGASMEESTWILTSYLITNAIVLPLSGWLSELMGRKSFFLFCILGFTITSFLCGIATTLPILIIFRLLQGLAGGGLQPSQQAIIKDSFPPEKLGMAFAITGIATVFAPILGPALGGYITDEFSWRWIFFINIPIGVLAAILVKKFVYDPVESQKKKVGSIDYIGLGFIAIGLGTLQLVLDNGQQYDWFANNFIIVFSIISFSCIVLSIFWLLKQKNPIVNLRLFSIPSFGISCLMTFFIGAFVNVTVMLLPMLVQNDYGYNATLSGMILVPGGIAILFLLPVVGKLLKHIQAKYLIAFGMFLCASSMFYATQLSPQTDKNTFILMRILQTIGVPFLFVPVTTLAFSKISAKDSNNASAITVLMKNIGGSIGISLVTNQLVHSQQIEQSYLVAHLNGGDWGYNNCLDMYNHIFNNLHFVFFMNQKEILQGSLAKMYQLIQLQASILAYIDVFEILGFIFLGLAIISLFMSENISHKEKASVENVNS